MRPLDLGSTNQSWKKMSHSLKGIQLELARRSMLRFCMKMKEDFIVSWHHELICEYLDKFAAKKIKRLMITLPPRHGKKIADSIPVLTPSGWTTHGKLKKGDYVFSPSGKPVKILATNAKSLVDMEVEFANGEIIKCHENHEWTFFDRSMNKYRTAETQRFMNSRLGGKVKILSGNRCLLQLPAIKELEFSEQDLPLTPYLLGLWLGDGSQEKPCITHSPKDLEPIKRVVGDGLEISSQHEHKDTGVLTSYFSNQGVIQTLKELELYKNKHIPHCYKFSSIGQRLELLAGLIDSDGHVEEATGRVRFVNCNKRLIDDVYEVALTLGFKPYITKQEPALSTSGIQGKQVVYTVGFQPTIDIPTEIPRKKIKRLDFAKRRIGVVDIRKTENPEMGKCIQVDSDDGLYLVGEKLTPTHNSELCSRLFPAYILGKYPDDSIISASYGADLASRMNRDVQRYMDSPEYRELFPESYLGKDNIRTKSGKALRNNDIFELVNRKGVYKCAGIGGALTGMGGNWLLCLPAGQKIITDKGLLDIKDIVEAKLDVMILSYNHKKNKVEFKEIEEYEKNPGRPLVEIDTGDKVIECTEDHPIYVEGKGYIKAINVQEGDVILEYKDA
jgi:hypothetical protein